MPPNFPLLATTNSLVGFLYCTPCPFQVSHATTPAPLVAGWCLPLLVSNALGHSPCLTGHPFLCPWLPLLACALILRQPPTLPLLALQSTPSPPLPESWLSLLAYAICPLSRSWLFSPCHRRPFVLLVRCCRASPATSLAVLNSPPLLFGHVKNIAC